MATSNEKSWDIDVDIERNTIRVTHRGLLDLPTARVARDDVAAVARQTGLRMLIVDLRKADIRFTTTDHYQYHREHIRVFPHGMRMACIYSGEQLELLGDNATFSETVAGNRGFIMKGFVVVEEANAWADRFAPTRVAARDG